jgi:hypothetical protein
MKYGVKWRQHRKHQRLAKMAARNGNNGGEYQENGVSGENGVSWREISSRNAPRSTYRSAAKQHGWRGGNENNQYQ